MPPVDRRNPIRAASSESTCNLVEFFREFPDDETCLAHIWRERFWADGEHAFCERWEPGRGSKGTGTAKKRRGGFCRPAGFGFHPWRGRPSDGPPPSFHFCFNSF